MYLTTASTIEEVITYGVLPAIEFLNMAQDAREDGEDDRAAMLELEARGKLHVIEQALSRIDRAGRDDKAVKPSFLGGMIGVG